MNEDDPLYLQMEAGIIRSLAKWRDGEEEDIQRALENQDYRWGPPTWPRGNSSPMRTVSREEFEQIVANAPNVSFA